MAVARAMSGVLESAITLISIDSAAGSPVRAALNALAQSWKGVSGSGYQFEK